jgi:hypothetical protein
MKKWLLSDGNIEKMFRWIRESVTLMYAHHKHPVPMTALIFAYMETFGKALIVCKKPEQEITNKNKAIIKTTMKNLILSIQLNENLYLDKLTKTVIAKIENKQGPTTQGKVRTFIEAYMIELNKFLKVNNLNFDSKVYVDKKSYTISKILGDFYRCGLVHQFWMKKGRALFENRTQGAPKQYLWLKTRRTKVYFIGINIDFLVPDFLSAITVYQNSVYNSKTDNRKRLSSAVLN